ncbi:MAG TPA: GMC family oxidoreductase [Candidatus Limnocylindrales bacterium]
MDQERILASIVDAFAPGGEGLPAASALGIHRLILSEVRALGRPTLERELGLLLGAMENPVANVALVGRPVRFSALGQAARESYLRRFAASPIGTKRTAFQDLKRLTFLLLYGLDDSPYRALTGFAPPVPDAARLNSVRVRTPTAGETIDADVAVIGSGAGGAVVAAELAAAGRAVVILERAANVTEGRFGCGELEGLATLFLDRGLAATSDRGIAIRAGSAVGGGTVVNWSTSLRADPLVREEWRTAGIEDDLDEHYASVEARLHVTTDESPCNGPNRMLERGLLARGLPARTIPRNVEGCGDCGPCAIGCRRGAKRSTLRTYLEDASRDGAVVLDRAEARRILVENGRAVGVVARVPGGQATIRAGQVVLAGGSILSPAVLQRSGIAPQTAGRTLFIHPVAAVAGIYDEPLDAWAGVPQAVVCEAFSHVDGAWGFTVETAPTHTGLIASGLTWWTSDGHRRTMSEARNVAAFLAIVRDRTVGRVDLDRDGAVRVRYRPGAAERALLRRGMVELARIHRAAGARRQEALATPPITLEPGGSFDVFEDRLARADVGPNRVLLFTAHQMSSCRIGRDRRTSVADPDGQAWDVRGLWIGDASALPTSTGVNPMLSIMAVARRTARRMIAAS